MSKENQTFNIGHNLRGKEVKIGDILIGKLMLGQFGEDKLEVVYLTEQVNENYSHYFGICLKRIDKRKERIYYQYYPGLVAGFRHYE